MSYACGTYLTKPVVPLCVTQQTYNSTNESLSYILNIQGK